MLFLKVKLLENVDGGGAKTEEGAKEQGRKLFDHLVDTISKEVEQIVGFCKLFMHLPKKYEKREKDPEVAWNLIMDKIKNECANVLKQSQDQSRPPINSSFLKIFDCLVLI